jgi:hypothetical protein
MTSTILAATDLMSGTKSLYTIIVFILVVASLVGGGFRAVGAFFGGRIGHAISWGLVGVVVAVIIGSGYAIYVSTKRTTDQTGITTGQLGQQ